ncbi:MAG: hypothetical protein PHR66_13630, partial [Desulfuromonadaceae bacterium]|nr:hypothetical protein [Desulfuromonadaceae bacterium]
MESRKYSPKEFMKARRPERFSDSVIVEGSALDRSMLEYHLDKITNRGQETDFEHFALRLAQLIICPNLLPQTGPTGGGDSKVDSETYPVSDGLSLIWHVGYAREAATERWGFAFSAKKDWRPKVRSDIAKIAGTKRGYSKDFFSSNQFIPDRTRAEVEDLLRNEHQLDVRILDRTWILNSIFEGRHESLAIDELKLTTALRKEVRKGPRDNEREQDLAEVEKQIETAIQQSSSGYQLVEDCLEAALLARGLERPRTQVDGLFLRAERVAIKNGNDHQCLKSVYERAWTTYWWYEDIESFVELYTEVEKYAKDSRNAYDLELLTNLWFILYSATKLHDVSKTNTLLEERTLTLTTEWERLSKEEDRLSTALQARSQLLLMRLTAEMPTVTNHTLEELREVVLQSRGLVGFPLEPLVEILMESGDVIGNLPAYTQIFETIVEITAKRKGDVVAAQLLVKRGAQLLDGEQPYEAIRTLGRALRRLYKHESRHDIVHALYLCGNAYEEIGLLWAARGTLLSAASIAINDFWSYSDITPEQAACFNRLKWLELRLGRIPQILNWHEVERIISGVLAERYHQVDHYLENGFLFDTIFGMLLMKSDIRQLKHLSSFPDVLEKAGLSSAAIALLFSLGHVDKLPGNLLGMEVNKEEIYDFFVKWRDQPAAHNLPEYPVLYDDSSVTLNSNLLGCRITIISEVSSPCIELAESILAALESLLSTALDDRLIAREPSFSIQISKSDTSEESYNYTFKDIDGRPHVDIVCSGFNPHGMSLEMQTGIKNKLFKLLVRVLAKVYYHGEPEQLVTKLFRDELAIERSIDFTSSFGNIGNVLGHSPKTQLSSWSNTDARDYPLARDEVWDNSDRKSRYESVKSADRSMSKFGKGEPPPEVLNLQSAKHSQMETMSLIRESLWNRA